MSYGSGDAAGLLATDTVSMGPYTVNPQTFGSYTRLIPSDHLSSLMWTRSLISDSTAAGMGSTKGVDCCSKTTQPGAKMEGAVGRHTSIISLLPNIMYFPLERSVSNLSTVAVNEASITAPISGILGLAFQGLANDRAVPFWQALINQNQLTSPEFCFLFTRFVNNTSPTSEEPGGVMTLGGANTTLYQGEMDFQTFTDPKKGGSFWLQTISGAYCTRV